MDEPGRNGEESELRYKETKGDLFRRWAISNIPCVASSKVGMTSRQCADSFQELSLPRVSNLLYELVQEGYLSRRENAEGKHEYFLLSHVSPDHYMVARQKQVMLDKKESAQASLVTRYKNMAEKYKQAGLQHQMHVTCECGRTIGISIQGEVTSNEPKDPA